MKTKTKPKAIDLFSGCGGFTIGMAMGGFDIVGHVEWEKDALATYKLNNSYWPNSELIGRDITKISDDQIKLFKDKHGHISLIFGGPPCQSYSLSGLRKIGDPRDNLFLHYVRFVKIIQPDMFIVENVPGMLSKTNAEGKFMIDIIIETFKLIGGYHVKYALLNAANYVSPKTEKE